MKCPHCGLLSCGGGCNRPPHSSRTESLIEQARKRRIERGDTLPDVEDDADDLFDADGADEITLVS